MKRRERQAIAEEVDVGSEIDGNVAVAVQEAADSSIRKKRERDPSIEYMVAEVSDEGKAVKTLLMRRTIGQARKSMETVQEITKLGAGKIGVFRIKRVI